MADPITLVTRPWATPLTPAPAPALPSAPPPPPPTPTATAVRAAIARATAGGGAPLPHPATTQGAGSVTRITLPPPSDIQQGIDQFVALSTPTYHTPQGDVAVPLCFRMVPKPPDSLTRPAEADLRAAALALGLGNDGYGPAVAGRAPPAQIQALTQKLIDMGCLSTDTSIPLDLRVRHLMNDHHIGLDCAGFVQQAFLLATGLTRGQARLGALLNESLSGLGSRHYARVAPCDASPGDIIALAPPPPPPHPHPGWTRKRDIA